MIGPHWSKGWIIEDNEICYSVCAGVSIGKYGDESDYTSGSTSRGYVGTIDRAREYGWSKENIGSHIVRNNHI
ncbi:MAG: xylosidase, partial [Bacteroidetes bacterium]|nr:xylosidase [Bacteroidota bacterium]